MAHKKFSSYETKLLFSLLFLAAVLFSLSLYLKARDEVHLKVVEGPARQAPS